MDAKEIILNSMMVGEMFLKSYLADLTDEDLYMIPVEGMNPIALQLGHLISTEHTFVEKIKAGSSPELPEGFMAKHSLKEGDKADKSRYSTREEYLRLYDLQRAASKAVLATLSDEDLAKPGPMPEFVPTVGASFNIFGLHELAHCGQFVPVRRKLGKPIAF